MEKKNKIIKDAGNVEAGVKFFNNAMSISEEYELEESSGFKHTPEGALIPKYDKDGTAILPASWRENDYYDTLTLEDIL